MDRPKDWWGNSDNAQEWIEQNKRRENTGQASRNTTLQSKEIVFYELLLNIDSFKNILEVGGGDGRLIGNISNEFNIKCSSIDINPKLSNYVRNKYPKVDTFVGDIIKLPFKDNSFDLVFTYQVLQHIPPEDIKKALSELKRVSKKEVWLWEGIGREDYPHGAKTHNAHNGSWVWKRDEMTDCCEVKIPKNKNVELTRQRFYRIKV